MDPAASQASLLMVQNMVTLCRQLRLPVSYKVLEWRQEDVAAEAAMEESAPPGKRRFSVVVHVHGDHAFKKYLQNYSCSDLLLYRGLLLQLQTSADLTRLASARVQQAFLPKFENEGQDATVADAVVEAAAAGRPTVVTVKHSGSLVTLSYDGGWAAKNSVGNEYTAGGAALLRAHYDRRHPREPAAASAELNRLFETLAARRLCLAFEMVTANHGHHGQLPAAEYLVTTAAHTVDPATAAPAFLGWLPFLELCAELGLPTNDTWLLAGGPMAAAVRQALDSLAMRGGPTGHALRQLMALVVEGAEGGTGEGEGCLHLPGTYPHDQWQGERLEGFVVAAGQQLSDQDTQRLRTLRDSLAAGALPLAAVPEILRRPYQRALREATAEAAEARAAAGGDAAVAAAAPPPIEAVRPRLVAAAAAWVPQTAVSYTTAPLDVRELLEKALEMVEVEGVTAETPYIVLPDGRGRMYSRRALAGLGAEKLQALLAAEVAEEAAAEAATGSAASAKRAQALKEVAAEAAGVFGDKLPEPLLIRVMRALAGQPEAAGILRYKKKMMMWTFPDGPAAAAAATAAAAAAANGANGGDAAGASASSASGTDGKAGGVVGYSLMTFVIRNGLAALRQSTATYLAYVDNLVRRSWGLPASQVAQVQHFARCWAAWVAARGGATQIDSDRYLDVAEPFAAEFLRRRGALALGGRAEDAFQGILICVDTPESLTVAIKRAIAPALELNTAKLGDTPFSKGMVPGAAIMWLQPGGEPPKQLRPFMSSGAAPFTWVVAAAPPRTAAADGSSEAKRHKGIAAAKLNAVTAALGPDGASARLRHVTLPAPEDDVDGAATARLAAEVSGWLGRGTPLPPADPAVAAYFVTIPGAGKSTLAKGLVLPDTDLESGTEEEGAKKEEGAEKPELVVTVLNSDTMKKTVKGFNHNRYWMEVASAADSSSGGRRVVVALADKNLVPWPPGNITRALDPLKGTGISSLALVPVVAGPSSLSAPAPAHSDLYGGLPDLPFPLELVALCMMRTLKRRNHEGGLDGASAPSAATLVAMFAGFYRHKTLTELLAALRTQFTRVAELPVMRGDGVGTADSGMGGGSVPADVLHHVAEGLRNVNERSKPQLPAEWEARARELLLRADVVAALEALQLPIEEVRASLGKDIAGALAAVRAAAADGGSATGTALVPEPSLASAVAELVVSGDGAAGAGAGDGAAAAAAVEAEARVSYYSVSGLDEEALRAAALSVLPAEFHGRLRKVELHVTLWHRNDATLGPQEDLRRALHERVGSEVELEVVALDVSPQVIAAEVQLLSADEVLTAKCYHHITLMVEKGCTAAQSNELPARLAAGDPTVQRLPLPGGSLQLTGVVTAVEAEERPGPGGGKRPSVV